MQYSVCEVLDVCGNQCILLVMFADRHFGSGSGFNPNLCQMGGRGCQTTQTVDTGTVWWSSPNPSESGGMSAVHPAGSSMDSTRALTFGVCELYLIKIAFSSTKDMHWHAEQLAIWSNLVSVFYHWYMVFLSFTVVKNSAMNTEISVMPWLPNMKQPKLLTLCWRCFSGCGCEHFAVVFLRKVSQCLWNECLQPIGKLITQDSKIQIFDAALMLILRMR